MANKEERKLEKYNQMNQRPMIVQIWIYTIVFICVFMIIVSVTLFHIYSKKCINK